MPVRVAQLSVKSAGSIRPSQVLSTVRVFFFKFCDHCRSEGAVPANTLKRLVRKRKYKKYIFYKNCISEVGFELLPTKNSKIEN